MVSCKPDRNVLLLAMLPRWRLRDAAPCCRAAGARPPAAAAAQDEEATTLAGLTVTAQKREEALQDVPISVTALARATAARHRRARRQGPAGAGARPDRDQHPERGADHRAHPRHRHGRRQRRPGILGRHRHRRRLPAAQRRRLRRPGRDRAHRGAQGPAGHRVRQEHLGRRDQRDHPPAAATTPPSKANSPSATTARSASPVRSTRTLGENAAFRVYARQAQARRLHRRAHRRRPAHRNRGRRPELPHPARPVAAGADRQPRHQPDRRLHQPRGELLRRRDHRARRAPARSSMRCRRTRASRRSADPFARIAYSNRSTEQDIKDKGVAAEVNWITPWFNGATLTSITAQRDWQSINGLDFDFSSADILFRNADEDESFTGFETFSQEFRLTGATDSVDWMVGAVLFRRGPQAQRDLPDRQRLRAVPVGRAAVAGQPGARRLADRGAVPVARPVVVRSARSSPASARTTSTSRTPRARRCSPTTPGMPPMRST